MYLTTNVRCPPVDSRIVFFFFSFAIKLPIRPAFAGENSRDGQREEIAREFTFPILPRLPALEVECQEGGNETRHRSALSRVFLADDNRYGGLPHGRRDAIVP